MPSLISLCCLALCAACSLSGCGAGQGGVTGRTCDAIGRGLYERPDPRCTPGAINPDVTQANINNTICRTGWTRLVRPPERATEAQKRRSLRAYGDSGPIWDYEYDHLIPLELGGASDDLRNLWPEPGASPNPKDAVELALRDRVCSGRVSLSAARLRIASDWVRLARWLKHSPNG